MGEGIGSFPKPTSVLHLMTPHSEYYALFGKVDVQKTNTTPTYNCKLCYNLYNTKSTLLQMMMMSDDDDDDLKQHN